MTSAKNECASAVPAKTFLAVLCHGFGANADQLSGVAADGERQFPHIAFMLAEAPQPCPPLLRNILNPARRRQWFSLSGTYAEQVEGAQAASVWLNIHVDAELDRLGLAQDSVWFMGFSQGAMVALLAGLCRHVQPRGIVGISGSLLAPREHDFVPASKPPVLLVHGTADSVVPASNSVEAAQRLRAAGIDVQLKLLEGLDHVIVTEAAPYAADFVMRMS